MPKDNINGSDIIAYQVKNPLPAKTLAGKIIISITAFAQWLC